MPQTYHAAICSKNSVVAKWLPFNIVCAYLPTFVRHCTLFYQILKMQNFKSFLPHLIVITLFLAIVSIYFSPQVFQGKSLSSHDITQFQGMAQQILDYRHKYGEEPYWTNAMFSGMPNTLINMNQWGNLIKPIHDFISRIPAYPASLTFIGMICFYIMLMAFDVAPIPAAIGAIAFAFSGNTIVSLVAGHNAKIACMMYMPLVLAGMAFAFNKNRWAGAALFAIALALQIVNNHIQITYYLLFVALAYYVSEAIKAYLSKKTKEFAITTATLALGAFLALGTHAGYFLSIQEYSKYTIRGKTELTPTEDSKEAVREDGLDRDYVFNYSYSLDEPLTFLMADYYGGETSLAPEKYKNVAKAMRQQGYDPNQILGSLPAYFGQQPFVAGPYYMGAIVVFLFVLALFVVKNPIKWALVAISAFAVVLAYGKNLPAVNYLIFDHFPLYNKFRSVTMAVIIPQLCLSWLGVLALKEISEANQPTALLKPFYQALATMAAIIVLVILTAQTGSFLNAQEVAANLPDWLADAIDSDRRAMRTGDAFRALVFIAIAAALLWAFLTQKLKKEWAFAALGVLTLADLWMVDKRYLNERNFEKKAIEKFYTPTEANLYILKDTNPNYRVLNLDNPFNESKTSYFHNSIGGYSPAKLRRYQDLIERAITPEIQKLIQGLRKGSPDFSALSVLNMLNMRYVMAGEEAESVIKNPYALGNAWFVENTIEARNPDEEMAFLQNFNPAATAIFDASKFKFTQKEYAFDSTAKIVLTNYKPYDLTYQTYNTANGLAVFSEIFYPVGWTATIDGSPAEIKRVNYVLRALEIPAGQHTVRFVMTNHKHILGNQIGLVCSLLLIAACGAVVFIYFKKKS